MTLMVTIKQIYSLPIVLLRLTRDFKYEKCNFSTFSNPAYLDISEGEMNIFTLAVSDS